MLAHRRILLSALLLSLFTFGTSAKSKAFIWLDAQTLKVHDGLSEQHYRWENGLLNLIQSKRSGSKYFHSYKQALPDRVQAGTVRFTSQQISRLPATERSVAATRLDLYVRYDSCEIRRSLIIYDNTPGIEWRLSVRGKTEYFTTQTGLNGDLIEDAALLKGHAPHYFALPLATPHLTTKIVSFREATDHHCNPVSLQNELPYRKAQYYRGNLLLALSKNSDIGAQLLVKLSPIQQAQAAYCGFDFSTEFSGIRIHAPGFENTHSNPSDQWQEAYPIFSLLHAASENEALILYKQYELAVHHYLPERDNSFTVNTWGDRNRDSRVNEAFILKELDAAARLGVTHYQIDDGWQQGLSQNSSKKEGLLWNDWSEEDWQVNKVRFPRGLQPITDKARSLQIELGLWFNPSKANNYANWERDRNILVKLHRTQNISWIKIDGLEIGNKTAETRVGKLLNEATDSTQGMLRFNMDVTAGKRGGYFFFNRLGSIFLENRYTDWGNYYPHLSLRNLWLLSRYLPAQRLQIEWLNKWRNTDKYPADDPLQPINVPFDYQFATAMMAQPLAWFEATGLPEEAFSVAALINTWKQERSLMQQGIIHPIGAMPDGYSFSGFISRTQKRIYFLLFRENTEDSSANYALPVALEKNAKFIKLAGEGRIKVLSEQKIEACFDKKFCFIWGYFER